MSDTHTENEEVKNKWIDSVEKLSDDEKRAVFKSLVHYSKSDEFIELKKFCDEQVDTITEFIRKEIYSRQEVKSTRSKLDMYVVLVKAAKIISEAVGNKEFKAYLEESYIKALDSAVMYKVEEGFDIPFYSDVDLLKNEASVYSSLQFYLDTCMNYYDVDTKLMAEKKLKEQQEKNPHQPY